MEPSFLGRFTIGEIACTKACLDKPTYKLRHVHLSPMNNTQIRARKSFCRIQGHRTMISGSPTALCRKQSLLAGNSRCKTWQRQHRHCSYSTCCVPDPKTANCRGPHAKWVSQIGEIHLLELHTPHVRTRFPRTP